MAVEMNKVSTVGRLGMLGLGILPSIAIGAIAIVLPAIGDAFRGGSGGVEIKMVSTVLGLGMLVGAPAGGIIADKLGHRRVLIFSTIAFAVIGLSIMLATALWYVIAARFLLGVVTGTMGVGLAAIISEHFEENDRNRWLGYIGAAATLIMLVLLPLTGALADIGWRYAFATYGFAILVALAVIVGIPPTGMPQAKSAQQTIGASSGSALPWKAILLASVLGTLATGTSLYWPFRLRELGVVSAREMAIYGLPQLLALGLAAFAYGRIRRRLNVMQVFLAGAVASCISLVLMGLAPNPVIIGIGLLVEGCAVGMLTPNLTVFAISQSGAADRGRNIGLVKGALYGSPFLTQFILEPISHAAGPGMSLCAIAVMAGGAALFILPAARGGPARAAA